MSSMIRPPSAVLAADGAAATITVPFPPLNELGDGLPGLIRHTQRDRLVGAVLVRRGGWAVGSLRSAPNWSNPRSAVRTSRAQTKAGGWSQQRYARRRGQQAAQAYAGAADAMPRRASCSPGLTELEAVVTGWRPGRDRGSPGRRAGWLRSASRVTGPVLPTPGSAPARAAGVSGSVPRRGDQPERAGLTSPSKGDDPLEPPQGVT